MKNKTKFICVSLFFILISIFEFLNVAYLKYHDVKDYLETNINLNMLSKVFQGNFTLINDINVSYTNAVYVKDYLVSGNVINISLKDKKAKALTNGIIIKRTSNELYIQAEDGNVYIYSNLKPNKRLYTYVYRNDVIGSCDGYSVICSNSEVALSICLLIDDYEEI